MDFHGEKLVSGRHFLYLYSTTPKAKRCERSRAVHGMARVQNEVCIPQLYRNCFNTVFLTRMNVYLAFEC